MVAESLDNFEIITKNDLIFYIFLSRELSPFLFLEHPEKSGGFLISKAGIFRHFQMQLRPTFLDIF